MRLHNIKPVHKLKQSRRIGRGGKRGGYSGRGIKGQKSRAGAKIRPAIRDLMMKLPKQRGVSFTSFRTKPIILNLGVFEKNFQSGELINPRAIVKRGLAGAKSGKMPRIKILGEGELSKKLNFSEVSASGSARAKIEKAGGTIENPKSQITNSKK